MRKTDKRLLGIAAIAASLGLFVAAQLPGVASGGASLADYIGVADARKSASTVSVFDGFIPQREYAAIRARRSSYDATADILRAIAAVNGTSKTLVFPAGTYYVGEVVFSGHDYAVDTAGVTFRQKRGLTGDREIHPIITFPQDASNIRLGDVRLDGNIATDRDEYSPGIAVISAKNITIGNVHGEDIRGDVLYTYGRTTSEASYQRNLVTGIISGSNIYRTIVAMAGGQARIAGVEQDGPVGYRDLDIEPNAGGEYQPVQATVGFVRGSGVQITSGDTNIINERISIGSLDLNGDRIANSTPNYPGYPGGDAIALAINHTDTVEIGTLLLRNYKSYPVQLGEKWRSVRIGTLDFANADTRETTYKSIVLQYHQAGDGVLAIQRIKGSLASPDRYVLRSDLGHLKVNLGSVTITEGALGAYLAGFVGEIANDSRADLGKLCALGCSDLRLGPAPSDR